MGLDYYVGKWNEQHPSATLKSSAPEQRSKTRLVSLDVFEFAFPSSDKLPVSDAALLELAPLLLSSWKTSELS